MMSGAQLSFLTVSITPLAKKIERSSLSGKRFPSSSVNVALRLKYSSLSMK
jgi:hypothetical protein